MTGKSGYFDLTSGFFTVRTYWSETYEIDTNASVVQVDKLQVKTSYLGNEYPSGSIKIDGHTAVTFDGYRGTHSFYVGSAGTWVNVGGSPAAPWKISGIVHEADGTKSVTIAVSLSGTGMGSGWSVSGSKTVDLTAIPRASVPTLSAASPNVGDTVTLNTNRKVGSYTHDITYSVAGRSGSIGTNVGESVEWTIPMSLAGAIAGVSDTLTIHTVTRNNGTQIGSSDISVTLRVPENDTTKPAINSVILAPQHELPAKFSGVYVQGRSAVKAQVDATGNYSAIEEYSLYALGNTYTGNPAVTNALSITGAVTVKSTVTDKRGFTRSVTNEVLYYPYTPPSAAPPDGQSQITCKRCRADGSIDTGGTYLKIEAGKKFSPVNGINQCELRYRYAAAGGNFSPWVTLLEKGSASNSIQTVLGGVVDSVVTAYTVEIGVVDDIGSEKSVTFPIGTAGAVWHAAEGGNALGIGGYAQRDGVDCQWNVHMNGKKLTGLPAPSDTGDAVPKGYVDREIKIYITVDGAGAHNSIYRGKYLGSTVTDEQWAAIQSGTFEDLYIGDYWIIGGVTYRIAAFDYYYNTGDINCATHHVTLVPDSIMYYYLMNNSDVTTGGYVGSKMYTTGLADAKTTISNAFGSSHILTHRQYLCNAVSNGKPSGGSWYDSTVELMTEQNMYGGKVLGAGNDGSTVPELYTVDKSQYPLFAFRPDLISNINWFWLRDVVSASFFAYVFDGLAYFNYASVWAGVRPAFSICA